MMEKFTLWAQAIDNSSPDHFNVQGEELAADDSIRRQEAVSSVSKVIKNGSQFYKSNGVLLTADAQHFVLELPSTQRDIAGRIAPIICYGRYGTEDSGRLGDSAELALKDFAKRIGRTLPPDHLELTRSAFAALKKKMSLAQILRIGALIFVLLAIVYGLTQRG